MGKSLGILAGALLIVKLGIAKLPQHVTWRHIYGAGLLAGIGFTLSIFIAELAFSTQDHIDTAKITILATSLLAGCAGLAILRTIPRHTELDTN
jgi:NhaA family Na+:H+ antiporter